VFEENLETIAPYRYLRGRIDELVVSMEKEAMKFLEGVGDSPDGDLKAVTQKNEAADARQRSA